mmetsp:Transcript_6131/g.9192  ORF Transcript_6131/g.9192 Transcript_6131/m.9192 type:complete len:187 (+) Transcript_6131:24-584(+)
MKLNLIEALLVFHSLYLPILSFFATPSSRRLTRAGSFKSVGTIRMVLLPANCPYAQPSDEPNMQPFYKPKKDAIGTCPPGTTPENIPLRELETIIDLPDCHYREISFHEVWKNEHVLEMDMFDYIEMKGLWIDEEEEAEVEAKKAANVVAPKLPVLDDFVDDTLDDGNDFLDNDMLEDALGLSKQI